MSNFYLQKDLPNCSLYMRVAPALGQLKPQALVVSLFECSSREGATRAQ
ncbi:MAG: hypothetical protein JWM49_624 [Microbacteriaceae bacterium]|nr:hypothetical protein [Microbacteriaceae bacterium]